VKSVDQFFVTINPHHGHNLATNNRKKKTLKKFIMENVNFVVPNPHLVHNPTTSDQKIF
jgi:hypothetical protein